MLQCNIADQVPEVTHMPDKPKRTRVIRIDDDLWEVLKSKAIPLEDTPSDALRRIFREAGLLPDEQGPRGKEGEE
jgi:hypothetical protein